jgi:hypothetical protein
MTRARMTTPRSKGLRMELLPLALQEELQLLSIKEDDDLMTEEELDEEKEEDGVAENAGLE